MGVSRKTFYHYFENKYEVAQWYWRRQASKYLLRVGRDLTWHDSLTKGFEDDYWLTRFFVQASQEGGYESCKEYGRRCRVESLVETVRDCLSLEVDDGLLFEINFFADAKAEAIARSFSSSTPMDALRFAELLERCVPQRLHSLHDDAVARSMDCPATM